MCSMIRLGDICEKTANINSDFSGMINYIDISSVDNERKVIVSTQKLDYSEAPSRAKQLVSVGDIIISNVRPSLNAVAMILDEQDNTLVASTGYTVIRCNTTAFNRYVFYFCQYTGFVDSLTSQATGASYPAVNAGIIKNAVISLPSLEKQHRIADTLDKLQSIITHRKQQLAKLDELVKARFVEMFGDPVHNDRGWEVLSVETLCEEIYGGGTPSKSHPEYYENGTIPWVSSKDMKSFLISDSQIHINELGVQNSTARMVPANSVIMVIRSGILKHTLPVALNTVPITVNQDLKVFIPNRKVLALFLAIQFRMHEKDILSGVRAVTADNIEFNSLKQRQMIVPPMELQSQFVSFIEQTDKSKFDD